MSVTFIGGLITHLRELFDISGNGNSQTSKLLFFLINEHYNVHTPMPAILLTTLNARYFHSSFGLRYLFANLGALQNAAAIREFIITQRPLDIAAALLAEQPRIIGFGVYIWNVAETTQVISVLKTVRPELLIVLGGPEVSHEWQEQHIVELADYVITGQGDLVFAELCRNLLDNNAHLPPTKIINAAPPPLTQLALPYRFYSDHDLTQRLVYVESSRGCPFKCAFCLSALDRSAWRFPLENFLDELEQLYQRGLRHFKFVDRTFNLNAQAGAQILDFFINKQDAALFLHFELIPDHLPELLKKRIPHFPAGSLQFEIGVQTFNPQVQDLIKRRQDNEKTVANLQWLRQYTQAHLHADLIVGLPGEDLASFAAGFNHLIALDPHEIQVGILKRLRGTPIIEHAENFDLRFNPHPPYNLLCSKQIDFTTMRRLEHFARYWDLIGNSGRFHHSRPLFLGANPFSQFLTLSDWLFASTGQTHQIALERLFDLVYRGLTEALDVNPALAHESLSADYALSGGKGLPAFLTTGGALKFSPKQRGGAKRQARHSIATSEDKTQGK